MRFRSAAPASLPHATGPRPPASLYVAGPFSMGYVEFFTFLIPLYGLSLGLDAWEIGITTRWHEDDIAGRILPERSDLVRLRGSGRRRGDDHVGEPDRGRCHNGHCRGRTSRLHRELPLLLRPCRIGVLAGHDGHS